ncbi:HeH/LEM domain-containing protein [Stutzerimonas nitrititolerans]|uniref:HeH/LEM domain-containing protein n=1 Tax=Stutzerimonas nitrititolerans TaxID=2482751 RepID=UPI0028AB251F|nr:HeH/LEM domain-containing protein [Stutzerimonas nitrititolerans]
MKVIYTDKPGKDRDVCYRTAFLGVISSAKEVVVDGKFPGVAEAYEAAGIKVGGKAKPESSGETDPHKMGVPDLKEWLTKQGIEFDASAKKADLQKLIPATEPAAGGETDPEKTED